MRRHNESRVSVFLCKSIHDLCMLAHLSLGLCVAMELSFTPTWEREKIGSDIRALTVLYGTTPLRV